eukprot:6242636-Prymnesium_polylepis.1
MWRAEDACGAVAVWRRKKQKSNNKIPNGGVLCCKSPKSPPLPNRGGPPGNCATPPFPELLLDGVEGILHHGCVASAADRRKDRPSGPFAVLVGKAHVAVSPAPGLGPPFLISSRKSLGVVSYGSSIVS